MLEFEGPSAKCIDTNAGALSCLFLPFRPLIRPPGSRGKLRAQTTVIRKRPSSKCKGLASVSNAQRAIEHGDMAGSKNAGVIQQVAVTELKATCNSHPEVVYASN